VRTTRGLLALVFLLVLTPPAAFGQSAGDEQYVDPFQQPEQGSGQQQQGGGGQQPAPEPDQGGGQPPSAGQIQEGGDGSVAPEPTAPQVGESPSSAQTPAPATSAGEGVLPITGAPAAIFAALGAGLLVGGVALRRRA
jgi:hypothetical protein